MGYQWKIIYDTTDSYNATLAAQDPAITSQPWTGNGTDDVVLLLEEYTLPTYTSTVSLTSAQSSLYLGQALMLAATVSPPMGVMTTPTGTVNFYDGSTFLGGATVLSTGTAYLAPTLTTLGSQTLTAVYQGDANFAGSISSGLSVTVLGSLFLPNIAGVAPSSGSTAGGTSVVITGTALSGATEVDFGGVPATYVVNADNQITAVSPAEPAGTVDIVVWTANGSSPTSSSDKFTFTATSSPSVSGLSTSVGSTAGGTVVTIGGSYFTGATEVLFGSMLAQYFTVLSDGSIVATSPAQAAGTVDVTVVTPVGASSTSTYDEFTYSNAATPTVTGLDVSSGPNIGGTQVTILGTGFLGATSVSFGSVPTVFQINSDSSITAWDPGQATGTYHITVTSPGGTSTTSSADEFTDNTTSLPTLTGLSTTSGTTVGGTFLTLTGTGFTTASVVNFGGTAITNFTINSDSQITLLTPPAVGGVFDVSVSTAAGTTATSSSTQFSVSAASAPAVTSLGTSSGSTAGGTTITVNGSGFTSASTVMFGAEPAASFTVVSDSVITAVSPAQAAGTVDVKVYSYSGVSASGSGDHFTYSAASAPSVTGLATTGGSTAGGTLVTITGSYLTGASAVAFGTVSVSNFTVVSDSTITVYAPSQASGTVHVTVTTPSGTSSTSSADEFTYSAASAPSISGLATSTGPTTGGTAFTILGSYFTGVTAVTVDGVNVPSFSLNSDNSISAIMPNLAANTYDVRVTTPSGTSERRDRGRIHGHQRHRLGPGRDRHRPQHRQHRRRHDRQYHRHQLQWGDRGQVCQHQRHLRHQQRYLDHSHRPRRAAPARLTSR